MKIACGPLGKRYQDLMPTLKEVAKIREWKPSEKTIYDFCDEYSPELFLVNVQYALPNLSSALPKECEVIVFSTEAPRFIKPLGLVAEPSMTELAKKHIARFNPVYINDYADVVGYWGGQAEERFKCQVGCISNNDNVVTLDAVTELLKIGSSRKLKIGGNIRIPIPQYLGEFNDTELELNFLKSCDLVLDFGSSKNILNQTANGIFTLSTMPHGLAPLYTNMDRFLKDPDTVQPTVNLLKEKVLSNSTSYHRVMEIFKSCGINDFNEPCQKGISEKLQCS